MKTLSARTLEARNRAAEQGVRVEVVVQGKHYQSRSQSQAGVSYNVDKTSDGWTCECRGYYYTGCCKHIGAVERRAVREGWKFGKVAALAATAAHGTPKVSDEARAWGLAALTGRTA